MRCPKCHSSIRKGIKYCEECGSKLETTCPSCTATTPLGSKFCGECGSKLRSSSDEIPRDLSFEDKLRKIQKYLPEGLTDKILSQKEKIEGEHKQVTVLFCDMQGFTPLVERVGAENAFSTMDQVYELLIRKVHDYEGTVNEMTGDGIMALFGAPIAVEDAPQRAIRSAYAIHRGITKFNEMKQLSGRSFPSIKMRVGIHSGPVVIGSLGNDLRVEFKAVGDTVNIASRIEGLAEPETTYVSEDTFKLAEGFFRFEAIGTENIKGKSEAIKIYRVIAPRTRRTRFDVSAERGLTPLVGRQRELELLIDGYNRSKSGRGQSFAIVSEAGLGKSRLLYEFRKKIANDKVIFLEGRCLSYSRGIAYHPIIDVLKSTFNLSNIDDDQTIMRKVKNWLKATNADDPVTQACILELLSVNHTQNRDIIISKEEKKYRLIEALKKIVIKGSEIRPLVLAIEDLHWTDKSSESAFKSLIERISGDRVLLIFTYRHNYVPSWGTWTYHSQLNLNRFSNRESIMMVNHLFDTTNIEEMLKELILEKTEGIPFFTEEFIKSLLDLSVVEKKDGKYSLVGDLSEFNIPNTIQEVIMARVDSLPEGARTVLVTGAVIEREFSHNLLKNVMGIAEKKLLSHLSILKDAELIYERGLYPDSTYIFKHALTREVVYESIISPKRKKLHEKIGEIIEQMYQHDIKAHFSVLAEHYIRSENYVKGSEYSKYASKESYRSSSYNEAISHVRNLIFCLERMPQNENNQKKIIKARTALAMYLIDLTKCDELLDAVAPVENLAVLFDDKKILARIYIALGIYLYGCEEKITKGLKYFEEASYLMDESKDFLSAYHAYWNLGAHFTWSCDFSKAQSYFNKCLKLNKVVNNPIGSSSPIALSSYAYSYQGQIDKAYELAKKGMEEAEQSGYIFNKSPAHIAYGISCYMKGLFDKAEQHLILGRDYSRKISQIGWEHWACFNLGNLFLDIGQLTKAENSFSDSIFILQNANLLPSWIFTCKVAIAKIKAFKKAEKISFQELNTCFEKNSFNVNFGYIARNISEILITISRENMSDAISWINKAIENDNKNNLMWSLARDCSVYANLLHMSDKQKKADEYYRKALSIFQKYGAEGWMAKIEKDYKAYREKFC